MASEYPREQQNPPMDPGQRPEDQPPPRQRVPNHYRQTEEGGDPRFNEGDAGHDQPAKDDRRRERPGR